MLSFSRIQYIAMGLMLVVLIALATVCLHAFSNLGNTIHQHMVREERIGNFLSEIAIDFARAQSDFKSIQLGTLKTPESVAKRLDNIEKQITALRVLEDGVGYDIQEEVVLCQNELRRFRSALHVYMLAVGDDSSGDYVKASIAQVDFLIQDVVDRAVNLRHKFIRLQASDVIILRREIDQNYGFLAIIMLAGVVVTFAIGLWGTGKARNIVKDILQVTQMLGDGHFSCRLSSPHKDSLGLLCKGIDQMARQLEQSEAKLLQTIKEANQANQAKSEFLANMSHEIRTPMTAILGFSDLVYEETIDDKSKDKLEVIQRNGRYLLEIINDILDLSKIEANKLDVEQLPVEPFTLVNDIMLLFKPKCIERGIKMQLVCETLMPETLLTDPTRMKQILNNLISNAIKFTEIGTITVKMGMVRMQNKWNFKVQVIDTGIGMNQVELQCIFDAFSQADSSTTRKYGGTGLGLTISRKLAALLGGDLSVISIPNEGSRFTMTVDPGPVSDDFFAALPSGGGPVGINVESKTSPKPDAPQRILEKIRVLLVEDGPDNQMLIKHFLSRDGALVDLANNGQIALDIITGDEKPDYDVILMDMQMPVLDGYSAATQLRELGYTLPIIAVTANAMSSDKEKCMKAGCSGFVAKPVNRKLLIQTILQQIGQSKPQAA